MGVTNVARAYGWKRGLPDKHTPMLQLAAAAVAPRSDQRPGFPQVPYDQGSLGSCTANGGAGAIAFDLKKQGLPVFVPSRLAIYYNERAKDGDIGTDAGSTITQCSDVLAQYGAADEQRWPYIESKFQQRPPKSVYTQALKHRASKRARVAQTHTAIRATLSAGYPIIFGFTVYESFESSEVAASGLVPMPSSSEGVLGGHCVLLCGHNDSAELYTVRNSWGTGWGEQGYCYMPYEYIEDPDLASDFAVIQVVT